MNEITLQDAEQAYREFLEHVRSGQQVWTLRNDEGLANWSTGEKGEQNLVPFWSDEIRAQACARTTFHGYRPNSITALEFLESLLPSLQKLNLFIGVNLTASMAGTDVLPTRLHEDLQANGG